MHIHDEALEATRLHVLTQRLPVEIQPTETFEYTDDGPNVLYIPKAANHAAIHLFILVSDFFYLFQITIASTRGTNHRLTDVAEKLSFPEMDKWCFVFIVPPDLTLTVPQPWKVPLRNFSLYSVVDPDPPLVQ